MTYSETLSHIYALARFGMKPGLARIVQLLGALGNPQDAFDAVHVVGTNGKGSTASVLRAILSAGGYRTGLFTSPHLISFTERICTDGIEISEASVARLAGRVMAAAPEGTTFFEIVTALAALHFAEEGVRVAVFEAGMGGRLDATNALNGVLSVITPVSLDHTGYLGIRIAEIALEKAGICKAGTPVVSARQQPEAARVIGNHARELGCPLYLSGEAFEAGWREGGLSYRGMKLTLDRLRPGVTGLYQSGNVACALAAAELLSDAGFPLAPQALAAGVEHSFWPGRMELFPGSPRLLLDGAHNPAGAAALAEALSVIPHQRLLMVLGVMEDKELTGILAPLLPLAEMVFAVAPAIDRALPAARLAAFCRGSGARAYEAGSVGQGIARAREKAEAFDLILVCGSLFTVGEARSILLSRRFDPFRG